MSARIPLPPEFAGPFRVRDAHRAGIGEGRLRGRDLDRAYHGVRVPKLGESGGESPPADDELGRIRAYAPLLRPGERFSHTSAALLWGIPLPPQAARERTHVTVPPPRNPARGRDVAGHVSEAGRVVLRGGLAASDPVTLFLELATMLPDDELVAVGDALVLDPAVLDPRDIRPWTTLADLRSACSASHARGCRAARRAVEHVREGAESRPETLLRLLLGRAGLPEPELNPELRDASGRIIGRFDIVYRAARVIVEYDGDQHRASTQQYERDISRIERAIEAGWTVIRVRARGLFRDPDGTARRVIAAFSRRSPV